MQGYLRGAWQITDMGEADERGGLMPDGTEEPVVHLIYEAEPHPCPALWLLQVQQHLNVSPPSVHYTGLPLPGTALPLPRVRHLCQICTRVPSKMAVQLGPSDSVSRNIIKY